MDGVKRYTYEVDDGVFAECVLGEDFVAALAREDALREELAKANDLLAISNETLGKFADELQVAQQRLTAAEQRNADTIAKLELAASMMDDDERGNRFAEVCRLAIKSLKPTESGASE